MIMARVRAEEAIVDRILGLPAGSVRMIGAPDEIRDMLLAWQGAERATDQVEAG